MVKIFKRHGQSSMEWVALLTIVIAALLAMQAYFKRGIQGRIRSSVDSVGEQYDPVTTETDITQRVQGVTNTTVFIQNIGGNRETVRVDGSQMTETRVGSTRVDAY